MSYRIEILVSVGRFNHNHFCLFHRVDVADEWQAAFLCGCVAEHKQAVVVSFFNLVSELFLNIVGYYYFLSFHEVIFIYLPYPLYYLS